MTTTTSYSSPASAWCRDDDPNRFALRARSREPSLPKSSSKLSWPGKPLWSAPTSRGGETASLRPWGRPRRRSSNWSDPSGGLGYKIRPQLNCMTKICLSHQE